MTRKVEKGHKAEKLSILVDPDTAARLRRYQGELTEKTGLRLSLSQTGATLLHRALESEAAR